MLLFLLISLKSFNFRRTNNTFIYIFVVLGKV